MKYTVRPTGCDQVEVCEDELINLQGTIFGIDGDSIRILAKHETSKVEIAFKANELRKYFSIGNHVKVLNGRYEGETVGVVIRIEKERLHRLNMDGKVQVLPIQLVTKRKINRNAAAIDSQNNNLNVGDMSTRTNKTSLSSFFLIFCRTLTENGGIFVRKARNLLLAGGQELFQ
ncbi:unnamed protein product, partial [Rotaria sp. Silwood1]